MNKYDDLIRRAQHRLRKVNQERPTPDDDLICDLTNAMKDLATAPGKATDSDRQAEAPKPLPQPKPARKRFPTTWRGM